MHRTVPLLLALLAGLPLAARADETWRADPNHSKATFSVRHLLITNVTGAIPLVSATVSTKANSLEPQSVVAILDASKLGTDNEQRDADLRSARWLDTGKYPTIEFKSTSITAGPQETFTVAGDLTIHGVTKSVALAGKILGSIVDSRGRKHVGYTATTTIDRRDFGLTNLASQGGALIAGTDVSVQLDVEVVGGS